MVSAVEEKIGKSIFLALTGPTKKPLASAWLGRGHAYEVLPLVSEAAVCRVRIGCRVRGGRDVGGERMAVSPEVALLWEQVEELMDMISPLPATGDPSFRRADTLDRIRYIGTPCALIILFKDRAWHSGR